MVAYADGDVQAEDNTGIADLGGSVITGVNGNPLAVLASQLKIPMYAIRAEPEDCPLYRSDGNLVSTATDQEVRCVSTLTDTVPDSSIVWDTDEAVSPICRL